MFGRKAKIIAELRGDIKTLCSDLYKEEAKTDALNRTLLHRKAVTAAEVAALPTFYGERYYNVEQVNDTLSGIVAAAA